MAQSTDCLLYRPPIVRLLDFGLTFFGRYIAVGAFLYTGTVPFYLGGASNMRLMTFLSAFALAGHMLTFINRYFRNLLMTFLLIFTLTGHVLAFINRYFQSLPMTYMCKFFQKGHATLYLFGISHAYLMHIS